MTEDHLTAIAGVPAKAGAVPGMAHFAGTGPLGKCCRDCEFRSYFRQHANAKTYRYGGCEMYRRLTGSHGPEISKANKACKYFKQSLANT